MLYVATVVLPQKLNCNLWCRTALKQSSQRTTLDVIIRYRPLLCVKASNVTVQCRALCECP